MNLKSRTASSRRLFYDSNLVICQALELVDELIDLAVRGIDLSLELFAALGEGFAKSRPRCSKRHEGAVEFLIRWK